MKWKESTYKDNENDAFWNLDPVVLYYYVALRGGVYIGSASRTVKNRFTTLEAAQAWVEAVYLLES